MVQGVSAARHETTKVSVKLRDTHTHTHMGTHGRTQTHTHTYIHTQTDKSTKIQTNDTELLLAISMPCGKQDSILHIHIHA